MKKYLFTHLMLVLLISSSFIFTIEASEDAELIDISTGYVFNEVYFEELATRFTGKPIEPRVVLRNEKTYKYLHEGQDFTVTYSDNYHWGEATVTIQGIGKCTGQIIRKFPIYLYFNRTYDDYYFETSDDYLVYDGKPKTPKLLMRDPDFELIEGIDYEAECDDNVNAGTVKIGFRGIGYCRGYLSSRFTILPITPSLTIKKNKWVIDASAKNRTINISAKSSRPLEYEIYIKGKSTGAPDPIVSSKGVVTIPAEYYGDFKVGVFTADDDNYESVSKYVTFSVKQIPATKIYLPEKATVTAGFTIKLKNPYLHSVGRNPKIAILKLFLMDFLHFG